jgi:hypothetical protein
VEIVHIRATLFCLGFVSAATACAKHSFPCGPSHTIARHVSRVFKQELFESGASAAAARARWGVEAGDTSAIQVLADGAECQRVAAAYARHLREQRRAPIGDSVTVIHVGRRYFVDPNWEKGEGEPNVMVMDASLRMISVVGGAF